MYKIIITILLLFSLNCNSQEFKLIKKIRVPKTCPVTEITLKQIWIDGCVKSMINSLIKSGYTIHAGHIMAVVEHCHQLLKEEDL